jgi:hypothetical protein
VREWRKLRKRSCLMIIVCSEDMMGVVFKALIGGGWVHKLLGFGSTEIPVI